MCKEFSKFSDVARTPTGSAMETFQIDSSEPTWYRFGMGTLSALLVHCEDDSLLTDGKASIVELWWFPSCWAKGQVVGDLRRLNAQVTAL